MPTVLDHIALNVNDPGLMLGFYQDMLGLAPERAEAWRRGKVPFPSVRVNADCIIDFFPKALWEEGAGDRPLKRSPAPGMNHFCLRYDPDEWAALVARLADRGVVIETGPVPRFGAHGQGVSVYFHDPEGNYLEARHYPEDEGTDDS